MAVAGLLAVAIPLAREQWRNRRIVREAAAEVGVEPALLLALARTESRFRSSVRSSKGAVGLLQILPETADEVGPRAGLKAWNLEDPRDNARIGAIYLKELLRYYRGDEALALAAYHAGPGRVDAWRAKEPGRTGEEVLARQGFPGTRRYVALVLERRERIR